MADSKKTNAEVEKIEEKAEVTAIEPKKANIFKKIGNWVVKNKTTIIVGTTCLAAGATLGYIGCKAAHYESNDVPLDTTVDDLTSIEAVNTANQMAEKAFNTEEAINAKVEEIAAKNATEA